MSLYKTAVALFFSAVLLFTNSCKKEDVASINFQQITSPTGLDLYNIQRFNDSVLYACGGFENNGIIIQSTDTGKTWFIFKTFNLAVYDICFLSNEKIFGVGHDLNFLKSTDGGNNWNIYVPDDANRPLNGYLSELYKIQMFNDTLGFACGGENFSKGVIYKTTDGGNWQLTFKEHEVRDINMLNTQTGFATAYGRIYKTDNGGQNWNSTDADDDFFTAIAYSGSKAVSCSYNGGIYENDIQSNAWRIIQKPNTAFEKRKHYNGIFAYQQNDAIAIGNDGLITVTHDAWASFSSANTFNNCMLHGALLLSPNDGICVGDDGSIFRFAY